MASEKFYSAEPMWTPKPHSRSNMKRFQNVIENKYKVKFDDYWALHRWTVENVSEFWGELWNFLEIIHSKPYDKVVDRKATCEDMPKWFEGARLNYAQNMLRHRDEHVALVFAGERRLHPEKVNYSQLYMKVCEYGAALKKCGLKKGDRIACYMSNREEPVYAVLGAMSIGAIWSGILPLLGAKAVLNRLHHIQPKILLTMDRFVHGGNEIEMLGKVKVISFALPCLETVIIVPTCEETLKKEFPLIRNSYLLGEFLASGRNDDGSIPELEFEQLPFDQPLFVSYTSGTTGTPKALVHGIGPILGIIRDFCLHDDTTRDSIWFSASTSGWATWNTALSLLYLGATLVQFEGLPYSLSPTYLWDLVEEFKVSHIFLSPRVLDILEKKCYIPTPTNDLKSLKVISCGSTIVRPKNFDFVYQKIKSDIIFGAAYGMTEMLGLCLIVEHTLPVHRGEINAPSLGNNICCYDISGNPVFGEVGELVLKSPIPSLPLGMWKDEDGRKYKETYCSKFKGVFSLGDICLINPFTKGIVIYGRSDETLKPKGTRFGSSEIYTVVEEFEEIRDSLCVSQYSEDRDERAVLFIKMKEGHKYDDDLVQRLRKRIESELSKGHVPEVILDVEDIPYNINGKKMESLVKKIINRLPHNSDMVANPECLEHYKNTPELRGY